MALWPFIFIKREFKSDPVLLNHERIHIRQQKELFLIFFYFFYFTHYLINLILYRNHKIAYRNIIFEREAYACEKDLVYLSKRKIFNFMSFIK
ncbi:MAG: hypothetical protein IPG90_01590 [Bacteroidetes bacterium]|nr:hypothetical protein [Bacteroidota bacterium]